MWSCDMSYRRRLWPANLVSAMIQLIRASRAIAIALLVAIAPSARADTTPTEFVIQVLEPMGGRISRPKEWFYAETHFGPSYVWTITKEDTLGGKGFYTTGVRIQLITNVEKISKKTPRQFMADFAASKRKEFKVLRTCPESELGMFTRTCLETEEGPNRMLYTLFWSDRARDLGVVFVAGTTRTLWDVYAPTFARMGEFEIIDLARAPTRPAPAAGGSPR